MGDREIIIVKFFVYSLKEKFLPTMKTIDFNKYWIVLSIFFSSLSLAILPVCAQNNFTDDRPLSEVENDNPKTIIIERLEREGKNLYQQGRIDAAFQTWDRELKLRQELGNLSELEALTRIGDIAWQNNRKEDLRNIENRSIEIETESGEKLARDLELLSALGKAYQTIRSFDRAIAIYQKISTYAREEGEIDRQKTALETIGQLHLAKFDYSNSIKIYEELLDLAQSQNDNESKEIYLKQLIDSYGQTSQLEKSLTAKQQLLQRYRQTQQTELIPQLQITVADDYRTLERLQESDRSYREAFNLSWSLQQYSVATEALNKLGSLYRAYNERESALKVYEELLKVEGKISDFYGSIDTYDRIGQIHLELKNYDLALAAFDRGLSLAKILKYREDYFTQQIKNIERQLNNKLP
jgi:tetratricopeptide (TPR) repeat protein